MNQTDLFIEIKEELKQEKIYRLLKKLLPLLISIAIFLILITIGIVWRDKTELKDQHSMSEIFSKAIATEKLGKMDIALESYNYLIDNHLGSYASLANLKKAGILIERKEYEMAFKIYNTFVQEKTNPIILKYMAETKIAIMSLNEQINEKVNLEEILDRLQDKDNPWRGMAMELKVLWLLKSHQEIAAKSLLDSILKDETLSNEYKQRADAIKSIKFKDY